MDKTIEFLEQVNFEKQLKKLNKKLKNKKIIVYGTGLLFQTILQNFDLSNLNIIGISDRKYVDNDEGKEEFGYKVILLSKIVDYKPDYVLIGALKFLPIMENFVNNLFKNTKIKTLPLVDKPFITLLKEIFE